MLGELRCRQAFAAAHAADQADDRFSEHFTWFA
jgi:hypothetical protein